MSYGRVGWISLRRLCACRHYHTRPSNRGFMCANEYNICRSNVMSIWQYESFTILFVDARSSYVTTPTLPPSINTIYSDPPSVPVQVESHYQRVGLAHGQSSLLAIRRHPSKLVCLPRWPVVHAAALNRVLSRAGRRDQSSDWGVTLRLVTACRTHLRQKPTMRVAVQFPRFHVPFTRLRSQV